MRPTLPFQEGAPAGRSGKVSIRRFLAATLEARERSVVCAFGLFGVGSGASLGRYVYQSPPSRLRSWLSLETLYSRRLVFCASIVSLRSTGRMDESWWSGSRGAVRKAPVLTLTASFWTVWSFLTSVTCLPLYHRYVSTGRQIAL